MTETVKEWIRRAEYDVVTARAMLAGGRYVYVLFCCQQAVEKALKAVIIAKTGQLAPRIHNLTRLGELADVAIEPGRLELLARLSAFYFQSRYPGKAELPEGPGARSQADTILRQTEELVEWLLSIPK
jgi:HEPN domain-containing protein